LKKHAAALRRSVVVHARAVIEREATAIADVSTSPSPTRHVCFDPRPSIQRDLAAGNDPCARERIAPADQGPVVEHEDATASDAPADLYRSVIRNGRAVIEHGDAVVQYSTTCPGYRAERLVSVDVGSILQD
jgi:hypothetical protein